ncbi:MAG: 4Fe-4S dicluster domain-containing protein [Syntrophales bacterium]
MAGKVIVVDVEKCIGCRSCQVACKQWNQLPGSQTISSGTYQNPPDLQANTWTLVRFREVAQKGGGVQWLFWKDGCLHCTNAACINVCAAGARFRLPSGAVGTDNDKCVGCQSCVAACPVGKPRYSEELNKVFKCDFCAERVENNLLPACVKACPTGALNFGEQEEMLKYAYTRAQELGKDASVYGDKILGGTHVIYVLEKKVEFYNTLPANPKVAFSDINWQELRKPLGKWEAGLGIISIAAVSIVRRRQELADNKQLKSAE